MASDTAWFNYLDREYLVDDYDPCPYEGGECLCEDDEEESEDDE